MLHTITMAGAGIGAIVGGGLVDRHGWLGPFRAAIGLIAAGVTITVVSTVVVQAGAGKRPTPSFIAVLGASRGCIGLGAGALYPLSIQLLLAYAADIEDYRERMAKLGIAFLMQLAGMFAATMTSIFWGASVNFTIGDLTVSQLRWHTVLMGGSIYVLLAYAWHVGSRFAAEYNRSYSNSGHAAEGLTATLRYVCRPGARSTLLAVAVPWFLSDMMFFGKTNLAKILSEATDTDDTVVGKNRDVQYTRVWVSVAASMGALLGYQLVKRFDRYRIQLAGFGALGVVYLLSAVLHSTGTFLYGSPGSDTTNMVAYLLLTAGPNFTTFVLSADTLDKNRPALFFGLAAGLSKFGGAIGRQVFSTAIQMRDPRDYLAALIALLGFAATYHWRDLYHPKKRLVRRGSKKYTPKEIIKGELQFLDGEFNANWLGRGSFGAVIEATWAKSTHPEKKVAVKVFQPWTVVDALPGEQPESEKNRREWELMRGLDHKNVVSLLGHGQNREGASNIDFIVMEFMDGGTLEKYLDQNTALGPARRTELSLDVARGMRYLHSCVKRTPDDAIREAAEIVIHRDLKYDNVSVNKAGTAKMSDFGEATTYTAGDLATPRGHWILHPGEVREQKNSTARLDVDWQAVDVYAFGYLVFCIVVGLNPFKMWLQDNHQCYKMAYCAVPPPPLVTENATMRIVIEQCWAKRPEDRPSFDRIVNDIEAQLDRTLN